VRKLKKRQRGTAKRSAQLRKSRLRQHRGKRNKGTFRSYINVGETKEGTEKEEHHIRWLRAAPGIIVVGNEVSPSMAAGFERDHCEAVPASKNPSGVELLTEYKFLVLRMDLPTCATFIAVRERMATKLEQTFAEHHMHGVYRDKDRK
jgi:hypothetical protein